MIDLTAGVNFSLADAPLDEVFYAVMLAMLLNSAVRVRL